MPPFEIEDFKTVLSDESQEGHSEVMEIINHQVDKAVEALKSTNIDLKEEKKKLQEILDGMPGSDEIEKMKLLQERLDSSEDARLVAEGKMDEVVEKRTERYRSKIESRLKETQDGYNKLEEDNKKLKSSFDKYKIDNAIKSAAMEEGVLKTAIGDLALRAAPTFFVEDGKVVAKDSHGDYLTNDDGDKLSVREYVSSLKTEAPHFWPASATGGLNGGSPEQQEDSMFSSAAKGDAGEYGAKRRAQLKKRREDHQTH